MDETDRKVLDLLQVDARLAQAEIARRVGLSPAAVNERIRKLERRGAIRSWVAVLDDRVVGNDITAFLEIFVESPRHERELVDLAGQLDEVQECHYVTGEFSCLLKVKVADRQALRALVLDRINALEGVRQTRTLIVLDTVKETTRMSLPESEPRLGPRPAEKKTGSSRR